MGRTTEQRAPVDNCVPWTPWQAYAHVKMIREQCAVNPVLVSGEEVARLVQVMLENMSCPHHESCPCLLLEHTPPEEQHHHQQEETDHE
jgi:hypothetical protein